jgi:hypothetical protein
VHLSQRLQIFVETFNASDVNVSMVESTTRLPDPICLYFGGPRIEKGWYILWSFLILRGHLLHVMASWFNLWLFGTFSHFGVVPINLAIQNIFLLEKILCQKSRNI